MTTKEPSLTAAECAARTGLTIRALRVYEDYGLIHPERTSGGWRVYGARELIRLNTITLLKSAGLTLAQIKSVSHLDDADPSLVHVLQMQVETWKAKQEAALRGQALVEKALQSLHVHESLSIDELCNLVRSMEMSEQDIVTSGEQSTAHAVKVNAAILRRYVGFYKLSDYVVIAITLEGERLVSQRSGDIRHELVALSDAEFYAPAVGAYGRFEVDKHGETTEFVIQNRGIRMSAPRIDASLAAEIQSKLEAKIASQTPSPGSDAALRRLLESIRSGEPIYGEMSAALAELIRQQLPLLKALATYLGRIVSLEFRGVGNQGFDVYTVHCEHGDSQWRIDIRVTGIIDMAMTLTSDMGALTAIRPSDEFLNSGEQRPSSEAVLRRLIEGIGSGNPNYEEMSPLMAYTIKQQLPLLQANVERLGNLVAIEYQSTDVQTFDVYEIKRERGSTQFRIAVNDDGLIISASAVRTGSSLAGGP